MTTAELIDALVKLQNSAGKDVQVGCQASGCCPHAHPIESIELVDGEIIIRV